MKKLIMFMLVGLFVSNVVLACDCQIYPGGTADTEPLTSNESHSRSGSIPVKKPVHVWDVVHFGDKGEDVKDFQRLLNNHGSKLVIDGIYGPRTDSAWKSLKSIFIK